MTEARGFSGREEIVLLPCLMPGILAVDLTGLGERCANAPYLGDGCFEVELSGVGGILARTIDGVLTDFPMFVMLGRFAGVLKVFVDARKSTGAVCPWLSPSPGPPLELGLELTDLDGGRMVPSERWLEPGLEDWKPLDGGRRGLSEVKKLEFLFRTTGEGGMLCKVSIVRSESDGRALRGSFALLSSWSSDSSRIGLSSS